MVSFAKCNWCHQNIYGILHNWFAWCLVCPKLIEGHTFCYRCVKEIYDYENQSIKENFKEILNIICENCESQEIGFDYRRE